MIGCATRRTGCNTSSRTYVRYRLRHKKRDVHCATLAVGIAFRGARDGPLPHTPGYRLREISSFMISLVPP